MSRKFVVIGHVANDTEPSPHLGGVVSYAGIAAVNLGCETHVITKCPENHPYIKQLEQAGIRLHRLPSKLRTITTFQNFYDSAGRRKQFAPETQEIIRATELEIIPQALFQDATILIGTVAAEVEEKAYPYLSQFGNVSVVPQGYFRKIGTNGKVSYKAWEEFDDYLPSAETVILSEEDLLHNGVFQKELFEKLKSISKRLIVTMGESGARIYEDGKQTVRTSAFKLYTDELKDFTGAGDVYAAAFLMAFEELNNMKDASVIASFYAAVKITDIGGIGIYSIPTKQQVREFINKHMGRVGEFLQMNLVRQDLLKVVF